MNRISRIFCIPFFIIISVSIFAQKNLSPDQLKKDFEVFENIIRKGHPSPYQFTKQETLDSIFLATRESLSQSITDIQLFKKIQYVADHIRDGHLLLFAPNTLTTSQYHFPLILKILHTDFYTDTDDFGIPIGSKITKINNQNTSLILESLKKYVPTDGYNLTRKYRDIELKFGLFYLYEYGIKKEYIIEYIEPNGTKKSIVLPAESFITVKHRNTKRNSYFAKYHDQEDGIDFFSQYINNKEPFVYYKKDLKTAILTIHSFGMDVRIFKSRLIHIFKEIKKKKIKNLVIDIRNNDGGLRPNAIHLFSFITNQPFRQRTSTFVASLDVPERGFVTRTYLNEKQFLKDKFYNHPLPDGWKLNFDDLEAIMVPEKGRFSGNVYVLIGGNTFSAASAFALLAKNDPDILLVGEETGGGYYTHIGEFPVYYELPNSNIITVMYMEKLTHYVKDTTIPRGSGILPDRQVSISIEDLILGKDSQLDYVYRLIGGY